MEIEDTIVLSNIGRVALRGYLAPELTTGHFTVKADVYSFGVVSV